MGKIVAIANQKGGVGKTTSTINLGRYVASKGKKCLFLDFDPQNNLGSILAPTLEASEEYKSGDHPANAINMFEKAFKAEPHKISDNIFLIGADKKMATVNQDNIFNVADSLDLIKDDYDYIFIDCPPAAGTLQHAALILSDYLGIISLADELSVKGVEELVKTTLQVKKRMNPNLEIAGILLNSVDTRKVNDEEKNIKQLRKDYGDLVLTSQQYRTVRVTEARNQGKALFEASPKTAQDFGFIDASKEFYERLSQAEAVTA